MEAHPMTPAMTKAVKDKGCRACLFAMKHTHRTAFVTCDDPACTEHRCEMHRAWANLTAAILAEPPMPAIARALDRFASWLNVKLGGSR